MTTVLHYLYQYVKFGTFTTAFLVVIGAVLILKLLPNVRLPLSKWPLFILILALGLLLRIGWLSFSAHTPQSQWNSQHMLENDIINVNAIEITRGKCRAWEIRHQCYPGSFNPARPRTEKTRKLLQEYTFAFYYISFFIWIFACLILAKRWKNLTPWTQNDILPLSLCFGCWFLEHMIFDHDRKYRFSSSHLC